MKFTSKKFEKQIRAIFNDIHNDNIDVIDQIEKIKLLDMYKIHSEIPEHDDPNYSLDDVLTKYLKDHLQKDYKISPGKSLIWTICTIISTIIMFFSVYSTGNRVAIAISGAVVILGIFLLCGEIWLLIEWYKIHLKLQYLETLDCIDKFKIIVNRFDQIHNRYKLLSLDYNEVLLDVSKDLNDNISYNAELSAEILTVIGFCQKYFKEAHKPDDAVKNIETAENVTK